MLADGNKPSFQNVVLDKTEDYGQYPNNNHVYSKCGNSNNKSIDF